MQSSDNRILARRAVSQYSAIHKSSLLPYSMSIFHTLTCLVSLSPPSFYAVDDLADYQYHGYNAYRL